MTALYLNDEMTLVDESGAPLRVVSGSLSVVEQALYGQVSIGQASISNRDTVKLNEGYVDPGVNSQLSFTSNSTGDDDAGPGAQTLLISYYDSSLSQLKQETVTLDQANPVNMLNSDVAHVESVVVATAGVLETNSGTISIYSSPNLGGTLVGTIQPGAGQTFFGHHFVAADKRCWIKSLSVSVQGGVHPCATFLKAGTGDSSVAPRLITGHIRCGTNAFATQDFNTGLVVNGPARIFQWAKSDGPTRVHVTGSFTYYEENRL